MAVHTRDCLTLRASYQQELQVFWRDVPVTASMRQAAPGPGHGALGYIPYNLLRPRFSTQTYFILAVKPAQKNKCLLSSFLCVADELGVGKSLTLILKKSKRLWMRLEKRLRQTLKRADRERIRYHILWFKPPFKASQRRTFGFRNKSLLRVYP